MYHVMFQGLGFCTCNVATCPRRLERSAISQQFPIEARDQKQETIEERVITATSIDILRVMKRHVIINALAFYVVTNAISE